MAIEDADLRHLLDLARLELDSGRLEEVRRDLNRVLAYVDMLSEVDVDGVEPLVRPVEVTSALRDDEPRPSLPADEARAVGRADEDGRFVVPRTVDEGN